jgi:hypothetical protein
VIHRVYPQWIPQYTMVAFTRIPYDEAIRRAEKQDRILKRAVALIGAGLLGAAAVLAKFVIDAKYPNALPKFNYSLTWPKGSSGSGAARSISRSW